MKAFGCRGDVPGRQKGRILFLLETGRSSRKGRGGQRTSKMVGNTQAPSCDSLPTFLNLRKKREKTLREIVLLLDVSKRLIETSKEGERHPWMSPGRKAIVQRHKRNEPQECGSQGRAHDT